MKTPFGCILYLDSTLDMDAGLRQAVKLDLFVSAAFLSQFTAQVLLSRWQSQLLLLSCTTGTNIISAVPPLMRIDFNIACGSRGFAKRLKMNLLVFPVASSTRFAPLLVKKNVLYAFSLDILPFESAFALSEMVASRL